MPPFPKGSQEMKDFMAKIRMKKGDPRLKNTGGKKHKPTLTQFIKQTKVEVPILGEQSLAVPEYFAVKTKTGFRLVNPLTKSRNLASRNGEPSIKIVRKPVDHMVILSHQEEPISLMKFNKKDRETINDHFKVVKENEGKDPATIPDSKPFKNKERGRPEKMPKNIEINKERKAPKKAEETKEETKQEETKKKGRPAKFETDEARLEAARKAKREWAAKDRAEKGIKPRAKKEKEEAKERAENPEDPKAGEIRGLEEKLRQAENQYYGIVVNAPGMFTTLTGRRKPKQGKDEKYYRKQYNDLRDKLIEATGKQYKELPSPSQIKENSKKNEKMMKQLEEQKQKIREQEQAKKPEELPLTYKKKKSKVAVLGGAISAKDLKALHQSAYKKDKDKQVGDWTIDESISKPTAVVYVNQKTKQPIVIHRGTEGTLKDWSNNLAYVAGLSKKTQRYKDSEAVQKQAEEKYGDTLTSGHSQGGIYSKLARNKKGIIDINPASMGEVATEGTTIRAKNDPVSLLAGLTNVFKKSDKNITTSAKANPLDAHSLNILDELGDKELGAGIKGKGKKFTAKQLTKLILDKNKVIEDLEKNAYGKGLVKTSKKMLGHLVEHITDMKEPVDKRDFAQAKMIIDDLKEIKDKKKISGTGIMKKTMEEMSEQMAGCGIHHHHHYHMGGMGMSGMGFEDMLRDAGKYVQPVTDAAMDRAMKEIRGSGFKKGSKEAIEHMARIRGMRKGAKKKEESDSESESDEEAPAPTKKRRGRFVKGSQAAKDYMASIRRKK